MLDICLHTFVWNLYMFLFFTHDQSPVHLDLEMHLIQHFFGNERISIFKKIYKYGIKAPIKSHTCIFFFKWKFPKKYKCWMKCISKKFTTTGSANTCNFFAFTISWNFTKFQLIWTTQITHTKMSPKCLSEWAEILQGFTKS